MRGKWIDLECFAVCNLNCYVPQLTSASRVASHRQGAATGSLISAQTPCATPGSLKYIVANNPGSDYQFQVAGGGNVAVIDTSNTDEGPGFYPPERFALLAPLASISTTSPPPNS